MKFPVPARVRENAVTPIVDLDRYREAVARAQVDPDGFWLDIAHSRIAWAKKPTMGLEGGFHGIIDGPLSWFADGELNVSVSCVDRHLENRADKVAILWEGDEPTDVRKITYRELHEQVCKTANALKAMGLHPGERVVIYMGMVPEAAIAMLACARLGAIHSVVFGGFSAEALRDRIRDCGAEIVITQDESLRGGKKVPLKATVDEACKGAPSVRHVLVLKRTGSDIPWQGERDIWWHDAVDNASPEHTPAAFEAEHPLFILYTSGSTGRPKGVVHTSGGYLTYASYTHGTVFDLRENDVFGCVADVGWITGHTYIVYGPLANGATTFMFESVPTYPTPARYWEMVERHGITIFYGAPTALRALAAQGDHHVTAHDRSTLRVLGTVGEPINPEAWRWYYNVVGDRRCNIVDTWWQTETGGIAISPIAPATPTAPGSATLPMPGIQTSIRTHEGRVIRGPGEGLLCIDHPWPGQARTVWGDHDRFVSTYFGHVEGTYFTGDGCRRDADGFHWITGRVDDVLNVSGHRMGTAEFESAIVSTEEVAEAAVVGFPHDVKGQGVYAFVVLQPEEQMNPKTLQLACREQIGAHAKIDRLLVVPGLPKTRSGKVMRRILRKIAEGQSDQLGDVSTLADPSVVDVIKDNANNPTDL